MCLCVCSFWRRPRSPAVFDQSTNLHHQWVSESGYKVCDMTAVTWCWRQALLDLSAALAAIGPSDMAEKHGLTWSNDLTYWLSKWSEWSEWSECDLSHNHSNQQQIILGRSYMSNFGRWWRWWWWWWWWCGFWYDSLQNARMYHAIDTKTTVCTVLSAGGRQRLYSGGVRGVDVLQGLLGSHPGELFMMW